MKLRFLKFTIVLLIINAGACSSDSGKEDTRAPHVDSAVTVKGGPQLYDSLSTRIKCPVCSYEKTEQMPTDVCLLRYKCDSCKAEMHPADGDCCVFCSYGDKKCPSMQ
jgi:hypothetical protein